MGLISNGTKLRLILGGGERLEGQCMSLRNLSATSSKCAAVAAKPNRSLRAAGTSPRSGGC